MYNCNKNTVGRTLEGPGRIKYFWKVLTQNILMIYYF
jgi:hypothetical protein